VLNQIKSERSAADWAMIYLRSTLYMTWLIVSVIPHALCVV